MVLLQHTVLEYISCVLSFNSHSKRWYYYNTLYLNISHVFCLLTVTQSDGTTVTLGSNAVGNFGPFQLGAGSADANYYINLTVRVFDTLGSFFMYNITPGVQVTNVINISPWLRNITTDFDCLIVSTSDFPTVANWVPGNAFCTQKSHMVTFSMLLTLRN